MYVNDNNVTNVNSFGVEYIPKEIKKFIGNKNIVTNIYIVQAHDSICGDSFVSDLLICYWGVKDLFSPNDYEKNDQIILKYYQ